ncbi:MAG: HAD-IB family hydrolase [Leptolyngbya sp. SIO4C5]|nr:HAD-IB family hydrolase [Leptolyngbya sp. SIO4C5]
MSQLASHSAKTVIAAFDFDGTLTYGDSFFPFLKSAVGPVRFYLGLVILSPLLLGYGLKLLPNWWVKQAVLRYFFSGWSPEQLQQAADKFAAQKLPSLLRSEAMQRLAWHQQQGHRLILVSASLEAYLRPWAKSMAFDQVIGTRLETRSDRLTGRIQGKNCYGPEKVRRLKAAIDNLEDYVLYAYGDSKGDRELLAIAQSPHYRSFGAIAEDKPASQRWQKLVGPMVAAVVLYAAIVLWSGSEQFLAALQQLPGWLIPAALGIVLVGFYFRFLRWQGYLRNMGYRVPWQGSCRIFFAGFALSASPGRAGESIRSLMLKRRYQVPVAPTLAGLLCERLTDLFAVFLLISFAVLTIVPQRWSVVAFALILIGVLLLLQRPRLLKHLLRLGNRWRRLQPIICRLESLLDSTRQLLKPRTLLLGIGLGALSWIFEGIALYLIFHFLGADEISVYQAVMILAASDLIGALSLMPGGIGGAEVTIVGLSILYGASQPVAITAMFLIRFITLWFGVWLGILAFLLEQRRPQPAVWAERFIGQEDPLVGK